MIGVVVYEMLVMVICLCVVVFMYFWICFDFGFSNWVCNIIIVGVEFFWKFLKNFIMIWWVIWIGVCLIGVLGVFFYVYGGEVVCGMRGWVVFWWSWSCEGVVYYIFYGFILIELEVFWGGVVL